jgi:hypothetical protein
MKNKRFMYRPSIDMVEGIRVTKKTKTKFEKENVKQELSNLILTCELIEKGDNYKTSSQIVITLQEGQILQFDEERGYFLPKYELCSVDEAIEDIKTLKDFE